MFKRISSLGLIAALSAMAVGTAFASTIDVSLTGSSGSATNVSLLSASTTSTALASPLGVSFSYPSASTLVGGWSVNGTVNLSTDTVDLSNFAAACDNLGGCDSLTTTLTISGLTAPVGNGGLTQILTGHMVKGSGSVTQWAMVGSDYIGSSSGLSTGTTSATFTPLTATGGTAQQGSYTLTLIDTFTGCTASSQGYCIVKYSTDSSIVASPEPGALAMFGAGLLGCALFINRRRRASKQS